MSYSFTTLLNIKRGSSEASASPVVVSKVVFRNVSLLDLAQKCMERVHLKWHMSTMQGMWWNFTHVPTGRYIHITALIIDDNRKHRFGFPSTLSLTFSSRIKTQWYRVVIHFCQSNDMKMLSLLSRFTATNRYTSEYKCFSNDGS